MQGINVFATTTARDAAITAPAEGQFAFTKDTNSLWYYDGAAWVASGAAGDIEGVTAGVGISGGGTSGTVTITNDMATTITASGDIVVGTGSGTYDNLPLGTAGQVLTADTTVSPYKVKWATPTGSSTFATDISVNGQTIGKGGGNIGNNTVHGTGGLAANTTGSQNTAIGGSDVLYQNTTGIRNTAVGAGAMQECISATGNTGVGRQALNQATGDGNTAIGVDAGFNITTGANNTCIGQNAQPSSGSTSNSITLGNSSVSVLRCQVTSITSLSDERDKKNIEPLEVGLDFVNELKPVMFDWNMRPTLDSDGNEITGKIDIPDTGFIAQDFVAAEDAIGLADHLQLSFRDNPDKLEISQGRLIPILVKAIQDLSAKVAALEAAQ
jgi:hypothetical protein